MTEIGQPLEEPDVEILPVEDPVPAREPVPVGPVEEPCVLSAARHVRG